MYDTLIRLKINSNKKKLRRIIHLVTVNYFYQYFSLLCAYLLLSMFLDIVIYIFHVYFLKDRFIIENTQMSIQFSYYYIQR